MSTPASSNEVTLEGDVTLRPDGASRSPRTFLRGELVGRYVMIERVGLGGMGVVYAAYDPDLDRKIALKLLLPRPGGHDADPTATARLQREAQATARLNHANVITVHDVGHLDGSLFIAMEYLDGGTLGQWTESEERTPAQIVARYVEAGRGLAAAHEAGLVHRDFKPDNVLLGSDGRTRVADFGLALHHAVEPVTDVSSESVERPTSLTRTGALMGTPAYMSPEQHLGEPADAQSDQFSYCVALYEALCGHRPWAGDTIAAVAAAVLETEPRELPPHVPAAVRRAIRRGLAREPGERWPSMDALLAVLSPDPARRRRGWWLGIVGVAAGGIVAASWLGTRAPEQPCTAGPQRLAEVWTPARAEALATALRSTEVKYAEPVVGTVSSELERYGEAWVAAYTEACRATRVLGEQSEQLLDRRISCLDRRLVALDATAEVLTHADRQTIQRAVKTVNALPSLRPCAKREALLASVPPPDDPEVVVAVEAARASIARAEALRAAGHFDEALTLSRETVEGLQGVDYRPALAEAVVSEGLSLLEMSEDESSAAALERGFHLALACGDDELAATTAANLVFLEGYGRHQAERAQLWAQHADALIQRVGSLPELVAQLATSRGAAMHEQGRLRESIELYEQALASYLEMYGEGHERTWSVRSNLAAIHGGLGQFDRALPLQRQVIEVAERIKGARHPDLAGYLANYGMTLTAAGRPAEAMPLLVRALDILEDSFAPDHPELAELLSNIGATHYDLNELEQAEDYFRRALVCADNGDDPVAESLAMANLANIASHRGEYAEAARVYQQVLEVQRRYMGDHPFVATTLQNLAVQAIEEEQWDDALKWAQESLAVLDRAGASEHPVALRAKISMGRARVRLGQTDDGLALLEQTLARAVAQDNRTVEANAALALARSYIELGRQLPRARQLAQRGQEIFEQESWPLHAQKARRWLEDNPPEELAGR